MSNDESEIIDAEIVEEHNLPAVIEASTRPRMENRAEVPRWSEEWWTFASPEVQARRCVAHKSNGDRCLKAAIKGATVCRTHGGATRHVKQAARIRLENAAELMAKQLLGIAIGAESESVKLAAIRDALDRAGLKAPSEVVLSQGETRPAYETVFESIGGTAPDESLDVSGGYSSAGVDTTPPASVDPAQYGGDAPASYAERSESSDTGPLRQGAHREHDREREPQPRREARSGRTPAPREVHVTGMTAIRAANEANRQAGALPPLPELESPHKRYPRP